jgi:hypothetical protein
MEYLYYQDRLTTGAEETKVQEGKR